MGPPFAARALLGLSQLLLSVWPALPAPLAPSLALVNPSVVSVPPAKLLRQVRARAPNAVWPALPAPLAPVNPPVVSMRLRNPDHDSLLTAAQRVWWLCVVYIYK